MKKPKLTKLIHEWAKESGTIRESANKKPTRSELYVIFFELYTPKPLKRL